MKSSQPVKMANLSMLSLVAEKLDDLCNSFVFLGGCATALLITDPFSPDVRYTEDVDCIIDVISLGDYNKLAKQLKKRGFTQSIHEPVICRWQYDEVILDVMPTERSILGFGNPWYKSAIQYAEHKNLPNGKQIKVISSPYFIATKLAAFSDRGNADYLLSHDLEDIISIFDGRESIVDEIENGDPDIKKHLVKEVISLLENKYFLDALPGHLNYGVVLEERIEVVMDRMKMISNIVIKEN